MVSIRLTHDAGVKISAIDTWFDRHLDIRRAVAPFEPASGHGPRDHAVAIVDRALGLYGELLGASYLTCFNGGSVVGAEPVKARPGQFEVKVALEVVDNIRTGNFTAAFQEALRVTQKMLGRYPGPEAAERGVQDLKSRVIDRLRNLSRLGFASETIIDLAYRQRIPFRHLGSGICRMGWGVNSCLLRDTVSERDSGLALDICAAKHLTAHFLRSAGYPVPDHALVQTIDEAADAARTLGYPVVVKPNSRERSEGVTVNIADEAGLRAAFESARAFEPHVLVERHIPGTTYRIQVIGGEVIYVAKRNPKFVVGDGQTSVQEIARQRSLDALTKPPWRRLKPWPLDEAADRELALQGYHRGTVLPAGERAYLRDIVSDEWGGVIELMTAQIHPDNARLALDATRAVGLSICGVDLITTDIARPWHENGAVINELNFLPQFRWSDREADAARAPHALVANGGRVPVHIVCGEDGVLAHAAALRGRLGADGARLHITSAAHSEAPDGTVIPMAQDTLLGRATALLMRPGLEGLILAGSADEMLASGFAVDRADTLLIAAPDKARAERIAAEIALHIEVAALEIVDGLPA